MSSNDPSDQELGVSTEQEGNLGASAGDGDGDGDPENLVGSSDVVESTKTSALLSPSTTAQLCLSRCFGYNKMSLGWILFLFLVVMILTTTLTTRNEYSSALNTDWVLVGGLTSTSATFRIRTDSSSSRARQLVVLSTNNKDNNTAIVRNISYTDYVATLSIDSLESNTRYGYQTLTDIGTLVSSGFFQTPATGRFNFSVATAGCSWTASTSRVFEEIRNSNPLLFVHLGDFHYKDINSNDVETRIQAIDQVLSSSPQANLFQSTALGIMWDDHDYLGNDRGGYESGREAALESFKIGFPYYTPLPAASNNTSTTPVSPYHAFTIGTVRFILTDLRSESTKESIYSDAQKEWLFDELRNSTAYDFVVWASTVPWIGPPEQGDDSWMGHANDRAELSEFISQVVTNQNLLAISADAHMVAFDDGRNTYYGTSTNATTSFPILQSGPLDRLGSNKGGPFSDDCHTVRYERNHQYSTIGFEFGDEACLEITSYRVDDKSKETIVSKRLCGEIFGSTENAGTGTCDSPTLSSGSIALVSISGILAFGCIILACYYFERCEAINVSFIVILSFFLPLIAGFVIPLAMGVSQYNTFSILLVSLIQMLVTFVFIVVWSLEKRAGKV